VEKTGPTTEKTTEKTGPTTEKTDITVEKTVEKKDGTVEKAQSLILGHLKVFPQATQEELQQITGLTRRGVEWNLKTMKLDGRLRRVGPDKGGHWEVLSPPSPPAKP
jgi:ATP-dependent DNA helicase RecG